MHKAPMYHDAESSGLPEAHNGLGLKLLGISGEEVLPHDVYRELKAKALTAGARHSAG